MNMDKAFKRRIHIEGKPKSITGYHIAIRDADTGELIHGVKSAIVYLNACEVNQAQLTYYEREEDGALVLKDGGTVESQIVVEVASIDVSAFERVDNAD